MKKFCAIILVVVIVFIQLTLPVTAETTNTNNDYFLPDLTISDSINYNDFLANIKLNNLSTDKYAVDVTEYTVEDCEVNILNDYNGKTGNALYTGDEGKVTFTVDVAKPGFYGIKLDFFAENSRGAEIERKILINGEYQHSAAERVTFNRIYIDDPKGIGNVDSTGNDIRPSQIEKPMWQDNYFVRDTDFYTSAMLFEFKEGINTITFESVSEPLTIANIFVQNESALSSYSEIRKIYSEKGYKEAKSDPIIIDAEKADYKSDTVLYPMVDRTTSSTLPYEVGVEKLNSIGGYRWGSSGQFLVWKFNVKEAGLYTIYLKARQNVTRGTISNRTIYIDQQIPFSEFMDYDFSYDNKWQLVQLGNGDTAYQVYLTAGQHEIKLEATLGELSGVIQTVEELLAELNAIYTTIMSITGSKPDTMRDYYLDELIPDEIERMGTIADDLQDVVYWYEERSEYAAQKTSAINTIIRQLRKMNNKPELIAKNLDYFKSNIGSLANWMISEQEQPLELDYIAFVPESTSVDNLPKANANFFESLSFSLTRFMSSFTSDYAHVGSSSSNSEYKTIKVWTSTGRDQAQAMRKIIDSSFTPEYKINVDLELVNVSSLLPATVAGIGPDVALNMGESEPLNYALRNAVIDLTQFSDYEEVSKRFLDERMVPLTFDGKVYALPETQTFNVMFYRKDIFSNLGLDIPQTWEDVISVITVLNKNKMNFALPSSTTATPQTGVNTYFTLLYQHGGEIYNNNGESSALSSEIGLAAFKQWTNFYVNYDLPKEYNFLDRFRTGEYPLIIGDYSNFNSLMVSAPEIRGMWGMTVIPGTLKEDGTIDRSTPIGGLNSFILKNSDRYDEAWKFLKWWTDADAQLAYGIELESVLGASARYGTANLEAFEQIPWSKDFYNVLKAQMQWGVGVEQVPGSYFTPRHLDNAFRKVTISSKDVKDTLFDYVYTIDNELTSKRREFGILD